MSSHRALWICKGAAWYRVEDTDRARSTKASEDAVLEDLKWLGLEWDEGMPLLNNNSSFIAAAGPAAAAS